MDKIVLLIYLLLLEVLFHMHHFMSFSYVYIFSHLFGIFIIISVSLLLPKKISRFFDLSIILISFLYVLGQDIYLSLFNGLFSLVDLVNASEGAQFAQGVYTFSLYHVYYSLIFVFTFILYLKRKNTSHLPFKYGVKKISQVLLVLFFLINVNAVYPVKSARLHTSDHYIYYSNYDRERLAERYSLVNMLYRDILQISIPDFSYKSNIETIDNYFKTNNKQLISHDKVGMFEGKNLVFILAESFDEISISESLTPNIYRLQTEGVDFSNHYVPVFPRTTCDTEIIINTGLIPSINDGPTCYMFNDNSYRNSLANLFNNKGYQTRAFHSNEESFYTRDSLYIGFGYDDFIGRETLGMSLEEKRFDGVFFDYIKDYYRSDTDLFYSFILSLSGHSPYNLTNLAVEKHFDSVDAYYKDTISDKLKYYIASQIELDIMIGKLFDDLEKNNDLENTVIIFMNDHYPYTLDQTVYESAKGYDNVHDLQKGTFFIWSDDLEATEFENLSSSFDVLPTIASLFDLDMNYQDYVGFDVFDDFNNTIVYFKDYYVYDNETYIDIFNPEGNYENEIYHYAMIYHEYSMAVLKTNYFKE